MSVVGAFVHVDTVSVFQLPPVATFALEAAVVVVAPFLGFVAVVCAKFAFVYVYALTAFHFVSRIANTLSSLWFKLGLAFACETAAGVGAIFLLAGAVVVDVIGAAFVDISTCVVSPLESSFAALE